MSLIPLPSSLVPFLESYLPKDNDKIFVTLTYAQSLDSKIAAEKGVQTKLSHLETKTMTHYIRSKHDAILVGIGTVLADDPKLNCRYGDDGSKIRPVILDPKCLWNYEKSTLYEICKSGQGLAPFIIIDESFTPTDNSEKAVNSQGGKYIKLPLIKHRKDNWGLILNKLYELGIKSVMVEGGAQVINDLLLKPEFVDSLIVTIAPVYLGVNGVTVSPNSQTLLKDITWWTGIQDSVVAARLTS
ncbi:RIB7 2 [Candida maltosa Xu316]